MRHFLKLVEVMRAEGARSLGDESREDIGVAFSQDHWKQVESCCPFVFSLPTRTPLSEDFFERLIRDGGTLEEQEEAEKLLEQANFLGAVESSFNSAHHIDAPFPCFSIEYLDGDLAAGTIKNEIYYKMCVLAIELTPLDYFFFTLWFSSKTGFFVQAGGRELSFVQGFLDRLKVEKTGIETCRTAFKIGTGAAKRIARIRRIVHVCPKREISNREYQSRAVDCSHRWEVRGHWMAIPGRLGKDRNGDYCVSGYTWRVHHEKGPKDLPLVKKTRVVSGEIENEHTGPRA